MQKGFFGPKSSKSKQEGKEEKQAPGQPSHVPNKDHLQECLKLLRSSEDERK